MDRVEEHIGICGLCNEAQKFSNPRQLSDWMVRHAQYAHNKLSGYTADASKSITVMFEGEDPIKDQEPQHTDPTTTFIDAISYMQSETT